MVLAAIVALTAGGAAATQTQGVETRPPNAPSQTPAFPGQTRAPERKSNVAFDVVVLYDKLETPWAIAFLPDGRMLVTEKGIVQRNPDNTSTTLDVSLRIFDPRSGKISEPATGLPPVDARNQGGPPRRRTRSWRTRRIT